MFNVFTAPFLRLAGSNPAEPQGLPEPVQVPDELDETIESMNDVAGKSPKAQSPKKRKASEAQDPTSLKKRSVEPATDQAPAPVAAVNGEAPVSKLRPRTSTAPRQSLNRSDVFALPDAGPDEPVLQTDLSKKPLFKTVRRLKRAEANPSPLKTHGEVETNVAHVNFRESPQEKRKPLVHQVDRAPKSKKPPVQSTRSRKNAASEQARQTFSVQATRSNKNATSEQAGQNSPENPVEDDNCDGAEDEAPSRATKSTGPQRQQVKEGNHEAQREESEGLEGEDGEEEGEEEEEEEEKEKEKKVEVDEVARKKERIATLMEGLEEAANLHGFRSAWGEMLFYADSILQNRSGVEAESEEGRKLCKRIKHVKNEFRHLNDMNAEPQSSEPISLLKQINKLEQCVEAFKTLDRGQGKRELPARGRDLYQHVVPRLIYLAIKAIDSRQSNGTLDLAGYNEISPLLALSLRAAFIARDWRPKPSDMDTGVRSGVRRIRTELRNISNHYIQRLHTLQWPIDETRRLDALAKQQVSDLESLYAARDQQRKQRLRSIQRARQGYGQLQLRVSPERSQREPTSTVSQSLAMRNRLISQSRVDQNGTSKQVQGSHRAVSAPSQLDYDELSDIDKPSNLDTEDIYPTRSQSRPAVHRQATEEIPGPLQAAWPEEQRYVLITALQTNTGAYRFQEIVENYGDQLGGRSLDEIVSQAKLIKASMARALETDFKHDATYDWLRSVPAD